jgi:hypothetical protein
VEEGRGQRKGERGKIRWKHSVFMHVSRTMKPVEIALRKGEKKI